MTHFLIIISLTTICVNSSYLLFNNIKVILLFSFARARVVTLPPTTPCPLRELRTLSCSRLAAATAAVDVDSVDDASF